MVDTYWQRHQESKAALQAAREAIDALERRLNEYWGAATADTGNRTHLRLDAERHLRHLQGRALDEAADATRHVSDAIAAWWPERPDAA